MFTDVGIGEPKAMTELFVVKRHLMQRSATWIPNVRSYFDFGATAYIVHGDGKSKFLDLINENLSFELQYDLLLRDLIKSGQLRGRFIFPFPTSISNHAESSQIQLDDSRIINAAWNAFRRLMWADSEHYSGSPLEGIDQIDPSWYDKSSQDFIKVLGVVLSDKFPNYSVQID